MTEYHHKRDAGLRRGPSVFAEDAGRGRNGSCERRSDLLPLCSSKPLVCRQGPWMRSLSSSGR